MSRTPGRHDQPSSPRWWWIVLSVGIGAWALFIAIDVLRRLDQRDGVATFLTHRIFDADADRGLAETTGYRFLLVAVGALVYAQWTGPRRRVYGSLALILVVIIADDALEIHERGGTALSRYLGWGPAFGVRAQDLGEMAVWALIAAPLGLLFVVAWFFSEHAARHNALAVVACLAVMLFFASVIDAMGPMSGAGGWQWHRWARYALKLFEFSGEFLAMVSTCLVSLKFAVRSRRAAPARRPTLDDQSESPTRPAPVDARRLTFDPRHTDSPQP